MTTIQAPRKNSAKVSLIMKKHYYLAPLSAKYKWLTPNFNGTFNVNITNVDVVGESEKKYLIRLKQAARDKVIGSEIWVLKKSVKLEQKTDDIDTTDFWYNNL